MTRTIEFDPGKVLNAAMGEFRRHGYAGTSIKTLEKATGLSVGSLYHSFGGKDAIFDRSMRHYNEVVVRQRIKTHLVDKPADEGLRSLFMSLLPDRCKHPSGCLLINSAVEFGAEKSMRSAGVMVGLKLFENAFQTTIDGWLKSQGVGPESKLAKRHATSALKLLAFYQGTLVLIRLGRKKSELGALINNEIDLLLEK